MVDTFKFFGKYLVRWVYQFPHSGVISKNYITKYTKIIPHIKIPCSPPSVQ